MKTINTILSATFLLALAIIACEQKENIRGKVYFQDASINFTGDFYVTKKGSLYFLINKKDRDLIFAKSNVDSIKFYTKNSIYNALPVRMMYSKEKASDLIFPVTNDRKKIIIDTIMKEPMFTLGSDKLDIQKIIKNGNLKVILIK